MLPSFKPLPSWQCHVSLWADGMHCPCPHHRLPPPWSSAAPAIASALQRLPRLPSTPPLSLLPRCPGSACSGAAGLGPACCLRAPSSSTASPTHCQPATPSSPSPSPSVSLYLGYAPIGAAGLPPPPAPSIAYALTRLLPTPSTLCSLPAPPTAQNLPASGLQGWLPPTLPTASVLHRLSPPPSIACLPPPPSPPCITY